MGHVWRSDQRTDASTTVHDARLLRLLAARLLPCPTAPPEPPSLRRIQTRARTPRRGADPQARPTGALTGPTAPCGVSPARAEPMPHDRHRPLQREMRITT